jgi:predicted small lipoprotein YifL
MSRRHSWIALLLALGVTLAASGCGRKGPLFLPPDDVKPAPERPVAVPSR